MQHKIHMQDQVTNRIQMIMDDQHKDIKQIANDIGSIVLIVIVLSIGIIW